MNDLISRAALIKEIENGKHPEFYDGQDIANWQMQCIKNAPAVDAEPVRHGKWKKIKDSQMYDDYYCVYFEYECSNCGDVTNDRYELPNYCPHCGTKMDLEDEQ